MPIPANPQGEQILKAIEQCDFELKKLNNAEEDHTVRAADLRAARTVFILQNMERGGGEYGSDRKPYLADLSRWAGAKLQMEIGH